MFLPYNRVVDVAIPWSEYAGCRTAKFSGGDPWDWWERLYIDTTSTSYEIGWDVFARSVTRLMTAINDYREAEFRLPAKEALAVAYFNSRRFAEPLRLQWSSTRSGCFDVGCGIVMGIVLFPLVLVMTGGVGALVMLGLTFAVPFVAQHMGFKEWAAQLQKLLMEDAPFLGGKAPLFILIGAGGGVLVFLGFMLWCWFAERAKGHTRFVQLRTDGLALGKSTDTLRVIPWQDVLYANVVTLTTRTYKDGSVLTSSTSQLEVHVRNQPPIVLPNQYGRGLPALSELIDPPLAKVVVAREQMAKGMDVERAAVTAGLPAR
jgi:hypothetical protein